MRIALTDEQERVLWITSGHIKSSTKSKRYFNLNKARINQDKLQTCHVGGTAINECL